MTEPFFTIAIPVSRQPHFLDVTLRAFLKNSVSGPHRILVLYDREEGGADDFETTVDGQAQHGRYASVEDYRFRSVIDGYGHIEFLDVGAACRSMKRSRLREGRPFEGGTDVAFKNNIGLEHTKTEWTIPNWDADFYPAPGWDESLVALARTAPPWTMVVPAHAQPRSEGEPIPPSHRLAIEPSFVVHPKMGRYAGAAIECVTQEAIRDWAKARCARGREIVEEPCGVRNRLHWVPSAMRTKELLDIGGYSLQGSGYDLEMDDQFAKRGGRKLGPTDSIIVHKAFPP